MASDEPWSRKGRRPAGATCAGGSAPPVNADGWWGDPRYPTAFYEADDAVEGFACDDGFKGRLCFTLQEEEYFMVGELGPFACPASAAGRWLAGGRAGTENLDARRAKS